MAASSPHQPAGPHPADIPLRRIDLERLPAQGPHQFSSFPHEAWTRPQHKRGSNAGAASLQVAVKGLQKDSRVQAGTKANVKSRSFISKDDIREAPVAALPLMATLRHDIACMPQKNRVYASASQEQPSTRRLS